MRKNISVGISCLICVFLLPWWRLFGDDDCVSFYAGFDGTINASVHKGSGSGTAVGEGAPFFGDGYRGRALLSGDDNGYVTYDPKDNIDSAEGAVEFWFNPLNWSTHDRFFHVFFEAKDPGWLVVYKFISEGRLLCLIRENADSPNKFITYDTKQSVPVNSWHHLAATWSGEEMCFYVDGKMLLPRTARKIEGLKTLFVGDRSWGGESKVKRESTRTLIDELYIYNRPLGEEEVEWAYKHGKDREPGKAVPFDQIKLKEPLDISYDVSMSRGEITFNVKLHPALPSGNFSGSLSLDFSGKTISTPIVQESKRRGSAMIKFEKIPPAGAHKVTAVIRDSRGKIIAEGLTNLLSPGEPLWKNNNIGKSDNPPPPYTPVRLEKTEGKYKLFCWSREYVLGGCGFPEKIISGGENLLAGAVRLSGKMMGKDISWKPESADVLENSANCVKIRIVSSGELGKQLSLITFEYDGMLRYDLSLTPAADTAVSGLKLCAPLNSRTVSLHQLYPFHSWNKNSGALPAGDGRIFMDKWMAYWWLGDEKRGLCGYCESSEAWDSPDRKDGFYLERGKNSLEAVWAFTGDNFKLKKEWKFTFALQATPVKDIRISRKFRIATPPVNEYLPDGDLNALLDWGGWNEFIKTPGTGDTEIIWSRPRRYTHTCFPEAKHGYKEMVEAARAHGRHMLAMSIILGLSDGVPEWKFYKDIWERKSGAYDPILMTDDFMPVRPFGEKFYPVCPSADYTDFIIWKLEKLMRENNIDGFYFDGSVARESANTASGFGYERDGKIIPAYAIFSMREMYKRVYTMLREYGGQTKKETYILGHTSAQLEAPVLSFLDAALDGEQFLKRKLNGKNWRYYLDIAGLDYFRTVLIGENQGVAPAFLPEFSEDHKNDREANEHLFGLMILHNISNIWLGFCDVKLIKSLYAAADEFGLNDTEFIPYWENKIIKSDSDSLKASIYRKPSGNSLICLMSVKKDSPEKHNLTVDFKKLGLRGPVVTDQITREKVSPHLFDKDGKMTVAVKPYSFRLLRIEGDPVKN